MHVIVEQRINRVLRFRCVQSGELANDVRPAGEIQPGQYPDREGSHGLSRAQRCNSGVNDAALFEYVPIPAFLSRAAAAQVGAGRWQGQWRRRCCRCRAEFFGVRLLQRLG